MRAERLHPDHLSDLDILILPELAFTGYNHKSLSDITPYLEPTADGPSTRWAIRTATRLKCTVAVGYPESESGSYNTAYDAKTVVDTPAYNSLVFVNCRGEVVGHHRKYFLYFTDDTWANEGDGFYSGVMEIGQDGSKVKTAAGICMDINPRKFEADWEEYEFSRHCRATRAKLVVVSMAWLTRLSALDLLESEKPDLDTMGYWIERFRPIWEESEDEVIVVFANRTGEEGWGGEKVGDVRYAGSSCVMGMKRHENGVDVKIWDIMGRSQDGLLVIDTDLPAKYSVRKPVKQHEVEYESATGRTSGQAEVVV